MFPPGMAVRTVRPSDNETVRRLFTSGQAELVPQGADAEMRIALKRYTDSCLSTDLARPSVHYSQPKRRMWLLESRTGDIVAMTAIDTDPESPGYAILRRLFVESDFRRTGVATMLTTQAESWALRQGFTSMRLFVTDLPGHESARTLYGKFGYVETGSSPYGPIQILEMTKAFGQDAGRS